MTEPHLWRGKPDYRMQVLKRDFKNFNIGLHRRVCSFCTLGRFYSLAPGKLFVVIGRPLQSGGAVPRHRFRGVRSLLPGVKMLPWLTTEYSSPDFGTAVPVTLVHFGGLHFHTGFAEEPDDKRV